MISRAFLLGAGLMIAAALPADAQPNARAPVPKTPKVWAIAIGIDKPEDEAIPQSRTASASARKTADWFRRTAGWPPLQTFLLDDGAPNPDDLSLFSNNRLLPTKRNLDYVLKTWAKDRVREGDTLVVYFAGQIACLPPTPNGSPNQPGRPMLLAYESRAVDLASTAWAPGAALADLAKRGANVVVWLDSSTRGRGAEALRKTISPAPNSRELLDTLALQPRTQVWLASENQVLPEPNGQDSSPFLRALLVALGSADQPANLMETLDRMRRAPELAELGFRTRGSVSPGVVLWSARVAPLAVPPPPRPIVQRGHAANVIGLAVLPDGDQLATASADSTVRLWRMSDKTLLHVAANSATGVHALDRSRDGRWLAWGDGAGGVTIWDNVRQVARLIPFNAPHPSTGPVRDVQFLPDSKRLLTRDSSRGLAVVWTIDENNLSVRPIAVGGQAQALSTVRTDAKAGVSAALAVGSQIYLIDARGAVRGQIPGPGGTIRNLALSPDGRFLAAADSEGAAAAWTLSPNPQVVYKRQGEAIDGLIVTLNGQLVVSMDESVISISLTDPKDPVTLLDEPADLFAVAENDRWLACRTKGRGVVKLWQIDQRRAEGAFATIAAPPGALPPATALTFSGSSLLIGDQRGGFRRWDLAGLPQPRAEVGFVRPHEARNMIASLSPSADRSALLQLNDDGRAVIWGFKFGQPPRPLAGRWNSAALAPDGKIVALAPIGGGLPVLQAWLDPQGRAPVLAAPKLLALKPEQLIFRQLRISPNGRFLAAGLTNSPLVCVWELSTGKVVGEAIGHLDPVDAIAIADNRLWTASRDKIKAWDIDRGAPGEGLAPVRGGELAADRVDESDPNPTALAIDPNNPDRVAMAVGLGSGRIRAWTIRAGGAVTLGELGYRVHALSYLEEGKTLAAAGDHIGFAAWRVDGPPRPLSLVPDPSFRHTERIRALVPWPGKPMFVTGSDDCTIRFWTLDPKRPGERPAERPAGILMTMGEAAQDWIALHPQRAFDGTIRAPRQIKWRQGNEVRSLEAFEKAFYQPGLASRISEGESIETPIVRDDAVNPPPTVAILQPPNLNPAARESSITLMVDGDVASPDDVRLYQNDMPIPGLERDRQRPNVYTAKVWLRPGENRFHALASPKGVGIDGRSNDVSLQYDGPEQPARTHVLAVGINQYQGANALKHALNDADGVSRHIASHGADPMGGPGLRIVLKDGEVTEENIRGKIQEIRRATQGRPQDTIVLFLAGHARVFRQEFHMLLPGFPFERWNDQQRPSAKESLLYANLAFDLERMPALQRLAIIDACQAEAAPNEPLVRNLRERFAKASRSSRFEYILAGRRTAPARESDAIDHGLLSWLMLRGMGADNLKNPSMLNWPPPNQFNADKDRDSTITLDELRWFAEDLFPSLAAAIDGKTLVSRGEEKSFENQVNATSSSSPFPIVQAPPAKE